MSTYQGVLRVELVDDDVLKIMLVDSKILDETRIQSIGKAMLDVTAEHPDRKVLFNLSGVQFISSAMIGKWCNYNKVMKQKSRRWVMCHVGPNVLEVFKIKDLNRVFDIQIDEERGLRTLRGGPHHLV